MKNILKNIISKKKNFINQANSPPPPTAFFNYPYHFNGEKNYGILKQPYEPNIDYYAMANRSWQLYLTTDITKIIIDRLAQFTCGTGLKLQYEPDKLILEKKYNIKIDNDLMKEVESLWGLYSNSKHISNDRQNDIANNRLIETL